jgi:hypothetical protein
LSDDVHTAGRVGRFDATLSQEDLDCGIEGQRLFTQPVSFLLNLLLPDTETTAMSSPSDPPMPSRPFPRARLKPSAR